MMVGGAVAAVILLGVGSVMYINKSNEEAEQKQAALQQQIAAAQEEANRNVASLQSKLADAASMGEAQRKALEAELAAAKEKQAEANENAQKGSAGGGVRRPSSSSSRPAPTAAPKPSCPPGDPMCGGL